MRIETRCVARVACALVCLVALASPALAEGYPLSLRDAVALALERNVDLAVARIDPQISQEELVLAKAPFDPTLRATAETNESENEQTDILSPLGSEQDSVSVSYVDPFEWGGEAQATLSYTDTETIYTAEGLEALNFIPVTQRAALSVSYSQSLLRDFGLTVNRTSIEQAINSLEISEADFVETVMSIVEQTIQGYWNMVGAAQNLEVAKASLQLAQDFLEQTKIKVDVGTLPPIEVTTAEAEVASREEQVIVAETDLGNAMDILRQLIGVPETSNDWDQPIVPTDRPGFSPVDVDLERAILRAYGSRPDLRQAELSIRNAELSERFFENQVRPDLVATGTYASTGNNFDFVAGEPVAPGSPTPFTRIDQSASDAFQEIPDLDNTFWSIQLQLVVPLGNRDARARLRRAKALEEQARLNLESLKLAAKVDVRNAVRGLRSASRRVASARANLALQRKKVDAEEKRYENGLSTAFQVLEFQNDLREAEQREIAAIIDYNNAEVALLRAQGILLEERGVKLPSMREEQTRAD